MPAHMCLSAGETGAECAALSRNQSTAFPPVLAQVALSSAQGQAMGAIPSSGLAQTYPAHPYSHLRNLAASFSAHIS